MSTIPQNYDDAVVWVQDRIAQWLADPAAIGLEMTDVTQLQALASQAALNRTARNNAQAAATGAVGVFNESAKEMRDFASLQVAKVRNFARASETPAVVYEDAQIPAPAKRSPRPAPGTPTLFTITLDQAGELTVRFKCPNPPRVAGVTYRVERSVGTQAPFAFLMNAKERSFTDNTVPPGSVDVTYRVTAQTPTKDGLPGFFTVRFAASNQAEIISQGTAETRAS